MKIAGKCYADIKASIARAPDHNPEIKLDDAGVLWVKVYEGTTAYWVRGDALKDENSAYLHSVERLIGELSLACNKSGISKAETKRKLISMGVISK